MELISDRDRRISVEELNTSRLLAHARKETSRRGLDDVLVIDVDAHHYENEHMREILPFIENDFPQALAKARHANLPLFVEVWAPW